MIISFSETQSGIISKKKRVTRRNWKDSQGKKFCKAWDEGRLEHQAYTKIPSAGGRLMAKIKLTCRPYKEKLADMPESDVSLEAVEGIETKEQFLAMPLFIEQPVRGVFVNVTEVWVVRFEVIEVMEDFLNVSVSNVSVPDEDEKPSAIPDYESPQIQPLNYEDMSIIPFYEEENIEAETPQADNPDNHIESKTLTLELAESFKKYDVYWDNDRELGESLIGKDLFMHLSHCQEIYRDWEIFLSLEGEGWECCRYIAISNLQDHQVYWLDLCKPFLEGWFRASLHGEEEDYFPEFDIKDDDLILWARAKINDCIADSQPHQLQLAIAL